MILMFWVSMKAFINSFISTTRNRKNDNKGFKYYTSTYEPQASGNVTS